MIKVAIFTEGQTEQLFACEAIQQLADRTNYYIVNERKNGKGDRLIKIDYGKIGDPDNHDIYFQILNCDSDSQVLSTIREEYASLVAADFTHIIGLRDVRPIKRENMSKLFESMLKYKPIGAVDPLIVIAIMEIESWLIAENSHFSKVDQSLTPETILARTSIDITVNSEHFDEPFEVLECIYASAGKIYSKSKEDVQRSCPMEWCSWIS
ncbi:hypothetical protein [Rhizobium sp. MHM7A]|uniref:hypothetical protein n=1 Tax=Rhizobium sp. MHM7A TaxID=2583233 RepID=UPI0011070659|nr:hypothetical protein [Rhizobium sp. MHM7A]TLX12075.1 hypothetical protein FFR93_16010 [Rhizobium sp. MHM7A]